MPKRSANSANKKGDKRDANGRFVKGHKGGPGRRPLAGSLSDHIRDIGAEMVTPDWTRLDLVIRRLFSDAAAGKTPAAYLLIERGWGKVPQQLDVRTEIAERSDSELVNDFNQILTAAAAAGRSDPGGAQAPPSAD